MRHKKSGRRLGRNSTHRKAMFSNMVASLVTHERIETTEAKAKELRRIAERTLRWATSIGDVLKKDPDKRSADERALVVHHLRMAKRVCKDPTALEKLFSELGIRFADRPGGWTRIIRTRDRRGDCAPMAFVEFVDYDASSKAEDTADTESSDEEAAAAE